MEPVVLVLALLLRQLIKHRVAIQQARASCESVAGALRSRDPGLGQLFVDLRN